MKYVATTPKTITGIRTGFVMENKTMVEIIGAKLLMRNTRLHGSSSSRFVMSCDKRLMMRPLGVIAKKDIGAARRQDTIRLCTLYDAFIGLRKKMTVLRAIMRSATGSEIP